MNFLFVLLLAYWLFTSCTIDVKPLAAPHKRKAVIVKHVHDKPNLTPLAQTLRESAAE